MTMYMDYWVSQLTVKELLALQHDCSIDLESIYYQALSFSCPSNAIQPGGISLNTLKLRPSSPSMSENARAKCEVSQEQDYGICLTSIGSLGSAKPCTPPQTLQLRTTLADQALLRYSD